MKVKNKRHAKILELVRDNDIETQDELTLYLNAAGFKTTQATVSRDIKELGIIKISGKGSKYKYALPHSAHRDSRHISEKYKSILRETVIKVDYAINTVVVNTYPGMAAAAAAAIDGIGNENMIGSLAGDDTIFIVMRSEKLAMEFTENFRTTLGM